MSESNPNCMSESAFRQFVASIQSATVRQKYMVPLKLCESVSERTVLAEEMKTQLLYNKQTSKAMSFHSVPVKGATTAESQVTSTQTSEESSPELALAQELESAKASGIDSTYIERFPPVKNRLSQRQVCSDLGGDSDDTVSLVGSPLHYPLGTEDPSMENLLNEDPKNRNSVPKQSGYAVGDNSTTVNDLQKNAGNDFVSSPVIDDCSDQDRHTFPQIAPVVDLISSQTSQIYFSATSAMLNSKEKSSDNAINASAGSIHAQIGSDDSLNSESEYSAPWDDSLPPSPSTIATGAIPSSEQMALLTEDFVPASDFAAAAMEGMAEIHQEVEVIVLDDSSEADDDGLPPLVVPQEEECISWQNANIVLMQRSKGCSKEEVSSDDELSSDGV